MANRIHIILPDDLKHVTDIANRTWKIAYKNILEPEQIRYMLDRMYRQEVLLERLEKGHLFYLICDEQEIPMGFAEIELNAAGGGAKLHKIYILPEAQGKHMGAQLLDHIKQVAAERSQDHISLNVNRHNVARQFYEKQGFRVISEEDIDIGGGYYMNDYVMQYRF